MKTEITAALITGTLGIVAAVAGSLISLNIGKSEGVNAAMYEMSEAFAPVIGDNNTVTVNDISTFISDYESTKKQNEQIKDLNAQYVSQLAQTAEQVDKLTAQVGDVPILNYQDLTLSINGENVVVNSKDAMIVIDGREYVSKEIAEKLLDDGQSAIYKNGTMYIGRIVADKDNLFNQWEVNFAKCEISENVNDSYGNNHSKVLRMWDSSCSAVYNLNKKYTLLKMSIAMDADAGMDYVGIITIKADDNVVYTSPNLSKTSEPYTISDISINNCSLLTIEYNTTGGWNNKCFVYDASVYN